MKILNFIRLEKITLLTCSILLIVIINSNCQKAKKPMIEKVKIERLNELISALAGKVNFITLVRNNSVLLVSQEMGGRIIGVSVDGIQGENLFWVNNEITSDSFFVADVPFINPGGHRSWIAPEDAFYFDNENKWICPIQMDPGLYTILSQTDKSVSLSNRFIIRDKMRNEYNLELKRDITILDNPPISDLELLQGIKIVGYNLVHSLKNISAKAVGKDVPLVGLWSLMQISPPGTILVPINPPPKGKNPYQGYFEPILPERVDLSNNLLSVKIDGKRREKIGIPSECAKGLIAYFWTKEENQGVLYVKKFPVEDKGIYVDGPWGVKRENGDVIQMYNDDGKMGGFAEIECHGPAKVMKPNEEESHSLDVYIFVGPQDKLKIIGSKMLGIDLNNVKYF